jgi:DNA-binding transcriptional MerR regulator
MEPGELSIGELADAAGLSRRAVRFYVQQKLLPTPLGRGRGRHYDATHLDRLRTIQELQQAGHSLDAIRQIVQGSPAPAPDEANVEPRRFRARPVLTAELWTRIRLMEGVELSFDSTRHQPDVQELLALRDAVRDVFGGPKVEERDSEPGGHTHDRDRP